MDLEPESYSQFQTFEQLYRYCYYVASVVGLVCIRIFGYRDARAETLAERLGIAFQLTNVIRDVKEDAALGRVYIPQEDLARFNVEIKPGVPTPVHASELLEFEAQRAREFYAAATDLLPLIDDDSRPALWALVHHLPPTSGEDRGRRYDVFTKRVKLSFGEKLSVLAKAWFARIFVRPLTA